jgi:cysteine-rich repeat protein
VDAQLGPLTDNGGPTATHAPTYPGSPAVDAAADGPATDQRGEARPQGEGFDSGAVEVLQFCGDGVLQPGEACDDGNTLNGDGCSAACTLDCNAGPATTCVAAAAGSLRLDERKPGQEKLKAKLQKFASAVQAGAFGDPVAGDTAVRVCVYDDADALALELNVDRAGDLCGAKQQPCWKPIEGKGYAYEDSSAEASGVSNLKAKGGKAGKGSLVVKSKNDPKQGLTSLPTGGAAALAGSTEATVQVVTSDAACFEARLTRVKKADGTRFDAKAP